MPSGVASIQKCQNKKIKHEIKTNKRSEKIRVCPITRSQKFLRYAISNNTSSSYFLFFLYIFCIKKKCLNADIKRHSY